MLSTLGNNWPNTIQTFVSLRVFIVYSNMQSDCSHTIMFKKLFEISKIFVKKNCVSIWCIYFLQLQSRRLNASAYILPYYSGHIHVCPCIHIVPCARPCKVNGDAGPYTFMPGAINCKTWHWYEYV